MSVEPFLQVRAGLFLLALITIAMVRPVTAMSAEDSVEVRSAGMPSLPSGANSERKVFFVTNAGVYSRLVGGLGESPIRVVLDGGAMVHLSSKNAVGGSWFVVSDGFSSGPVLRWRRWLGPTKSMDVAVGTILTGGDQVRPGSVLGLVKYNPVHWLGIAARPELVRYGSYYSHREGRWVPSGTKARLHLGAELGGKPGLVTGSLVLAATLVAAAALASAWD